MVPFIASLSLLIVCSIHLAALANMRVGAISQDETDARSKTLDDDRHARNVKDARELVELNCGQCSPERKRRMYQSEMARLEKQSFIEERKDSSPDKTAERSWGRRYVEDYATAVQLIFGLLCGLAMLVNNFIRLYADELKNKSLSERDFPHELDVEKRSPVRRTGFTTRSDTVSLFSDDTDAQQKTTQEGLKRLRAALKLIGFHHGPTHFKTDPKDGYIWIRQFRSEHGEARQIAQTKAAVRILDDATRMEADDFRLRLEAFLKKRGFEL